MHHTATTLTFKYKNCTQFTGYANQNKRWWPTLGALVVTHAMLRRLINCRFLLLLLLPWEK